MFDKIVNFFFGPDDPEEIETDEVSENIESVVEEIKMSDISVISEKEEKEVVVNEVKPKPVINIMADGPTQKETKVAKKSVRIQRKEEYEIQPVISPFHGVKGEVKNADPITKTNVTYTNETKRNSFNQVISPIYGARKTKPLVNVLPKTEIFEKVSEVKSYETLEEENIALDDIISDHKHNEDDMIQFSLFGDDQKINTTLFENEEVDDDLPF